MITSDHADRAGQVQPTAMIEVFCRVLLMTYISDPLSMKGSEYQDGRYHIAGKWPALYLSVGEETAWKEVERHAQELTLSREKYSPVRIRVQLEKVADLTAREVMEIFEVTEEDMVADDYTKCQQLALVFRQAGFEALLVWSAADRGQKNLGIVT